MGGIRDQGWTCGTRREQDGAVQTALSVLPSQQAPSGRDFWLGDPDQGTMPLTLECKSRPGPSVPAVPLAEPSQAVVTLG